MHDAWIAGKPAALESAVAEAAKLIAASHHPLIAGLGTDVAGARAAIALAQRTGAVIDHMDSDAVLRDLDVMRSSGVVLSTPSETHVRADTLLLVGPGLTETWPELPDRLLQPIGQAQDKAGVARRILWLCPGKDGALFPSAGATPQAVGEDPRDLPVLIAVLRARLAGRPTAKAGISFKRLDETCNALKAARFGVAIWSAAVLDPLTIEMLSGLVSDLNATTRFAGLPLSPPDNAVGVLQTCGWLTGLPMRTGFGRGFAEHDPWLFDGRRLVDYGETDCVLWISAYRAVAPRWSEPPTIALTGRDVAFRSAPGVYIQVGCPGVDHGALQHLPATGALTAVEATQPSAAISVAEVIARIASALPDNGERPC
jgi:formylmethanofuran dehydrogenase subunit B